MSSSKNDSILQQEDNGDADDIDIAVFTYHSSNREPEPSSQSYYIHCQFLRPSQDCEIIPPTTTP